ncbi:MAG TPA: TonB-dependent receptor [Candidatus Acidoferrum sp.]|nr:TonB-dependent receptor [Candidatus Acidoferrum sp.]
MFTRRLAKSFFLFFLSSILAGSLSAQTTTGRFIGSVHDPSGASINGAKVTVTDVDRGTARTVTTDESGDYVVGNLPPGNYKLRAESQGFKILERTGIVLEVNRDLRIDFTLVPGSIVDTVTVTEAVPLLDVVNNTLGGTLSNEAINELPLNGRDFQNLVTLRPGVQRYPGGGFLSISSNGNRPEDNNFVVDGIDGNDPYYATTIINAEGVQGTPASHLPIDAIQEFNAEENPPAEYGLKPGAIVNVGLKSGTNNYHGSVYYFTRNNAFDARNDFNTRLVGSASGGLVPSPQKPLHFHDFGATIGGAIIKDKLFYFVAYEGLRAVVGNSGVLQTPATVGLGGDAANSIPDAEAALQAHGIPLSTLSTSLLDLFPSNPATLDASNPQNLQLGFPNRNREDNGLVKMDWHPTNNDTITGRYFIGDSIQTEQDVQVLQPFWESQAVTRPQVFGVNWTRVLTPHLANEVKFGYNRFWQTILTVDAGKNPTDYGINTGVTTPVNFGFPEIAISGFNSLGGNHGWPLLTTPNQTYVIGDNLSYTHGKHAFKFGGEWRNGMADNVRDRYGKGRFRFEGGGANALCPDGLGDCFGIDPASGMPFQSTPLEDFLAGTPAVGRLFVGDSHRHISMKTFGAYAQDDWRVTPHLTINAGLRYDLNTVIKDSHDLLGNFDPNLGLLQVGQQISSPYNGDHNNFGPRLGIVWDPFGDGKTAIRAGASIIYEIPHISIFIGQNGVDNASTSGIGVIPTGAGGVTPGGGKIVASSNDYSNLNWNGSSVGGATIFENPVADCSASPCNILAVNRNLRTPYVTTWSLNIQRQLFSEGSINIGYVGNKGTKLYSVIDINQVNPALDDGSEQLGRPFNAKFPFLGVINFLSNGYESKYQGLQISYTQRPWHGLSMVVGYTWSHSIDQASLNRGLNPQNSLDPAAEYASSDLDIRQRFTLSLTYDLPGIKSWGHLLEGWQVNSIVTLQTGLPWGAIDGYINGNDISLTGEFADRWNFFGSPSDFKASSTGPIPYFSSGTPDPMDPLGPTDPAFAINNPACVAHASMAALQSFGCYFKGSSVLAPPDAGNFGTMGRNLFRGPSYHNWDFSIIKSWTIREGLALQLRGEFFNILNHPNFTNPFGVGGQLGNVDPSNPGSFGFAGETPDVAAANPVIGSGGPRAIQIGLKLKF